jgi:hypothetical protein
MRQIIQEIIYTQTDSNQIQYAVSSSARRVTVKSLEREKSLIKSENISAIT